MSYLAPDPDGLTARLAALAVLPILLYGAAMAGGMGPVMSLEPRPDTATVVFVPETGRVTDNPGGSVDEFLEQIKDWNTKKLHVEIEGECWSACTLYTKLNDVCVMEGAVLHFHAPYQQRGPHVRLFDPSYTNWFLNQYPEPIRKWIVDNGGLTPDWIDLKGKELRALVPSC